MMLSGNENISKKQPTLYIVEKCKSFDNLLEGLHSNIYVLGKIDDSKFRNGIDERYCLMHEIAKRITIKALIKAQNGEFDAIPFLPAEMKDFLMLLDVLSRKLYVKAHNKNFITLSQAFFNAWKEQWDYVSPKDDGEFQALYSEICKLRDIIDKAENEGNNK